MTAAEPPSPDPSDSDIPESPHNSGPDKLLQLLVEIVDVGITVPQLQRNPAAGVSTGITVVIGGTVISGTLISAQQYLMGVADDISRSSTSEGSEWLPEQVAEMFQGFASTYDNMVHDDETTVRPAFIHLRDARMVAPGAEPMPVNGLWWRGRLDRVDGFTLGTLHGGGSS